MGIIIASIILILTFVLAALARHQDHLEVEGFDSDIHIHPSEHP